MFTGRSSWLRRAATKSPTTFASNFSAKATGLTTRSGIGMLNQGEVGYFPANAYYGPQKCEGAIILIAQWGDHFITKAESDRAVAELARVGEFTDGIYRSSDANGKPFNKDPLHAI